MTRSDLIEELARQRRITIKDAEKVVCEIFDGMTDALVAGDRIEVRDFGSFKVREYSGYSGRNPKSGEGIVVKPKKAPFFKVGKDLKERVLASTGE